MITDITFDTAPTVVDILSSYRDPTTVLPLLVEGTSARHRFAFRYGCRSCATGATTAFPPLGWAAADLSTAMYQVYHGIRIIMFGTAPIALDTLPSCRDPGATTGLPSPVERTDLRHCAFRRGHIGLLSRPERRLPCPSR